MEIIAAKEGEGWTGSCGAEDGVARDLVKDDVEKKGDERDVASWVEGTSRVFRVRGQESVFVIPAWDMHPGAEAVRRSESLPFVQTVVRGKSSQQARLTVKERSDGRNDTEALKEEIDGMKCRLQYGQDPMQKVLPWKWCTGRWTCSKKSGRICSNCLEVSLSENDLGQGPIQNAPTAKKQVPLIGKHQT